MIHRRRALFIAALASTSLASASTDPVADTRQIMAGTVATKSVKQAYLSGARDTTTAFKGALAAYKAVRAAEVSAPTPPLPPSPTPLGQCPNGVPRLLNGDCPPSGGLTMTQCPDKVYVLMAQDCPALPKMGQWADAAIERNGWVQVIKGQPGWPRYGFYSSCTVVNGAVVPNSCIAVDSPGGYPSYDYTNSYRSSVPGEFCQVYQNGGGVDASSKPTLSVKCLYDGATMVLRQDNLKGVAPASGYAPAFGSGTTIVPYTQALKSTP